MFLSLQNGKMLGMIEVVSRFVNELVPYEKNPRKISDEAIDAVAESIQEFGFKNPILIDKNNVIIAGHTRRLASLKLGLETVPCVVVDDLTPQQIKALRLADNKTNELADWDIGELDIELADLLDMDMGRFGFESFMDDGLDDGFSLADGDRSPIQTMSFTFSDEQAEEIKGAIADMKRTDEFKNFYDEKNQNGNGNAVYLMVRSWLQQSR